MSISRQLFRDLFRVLEEPLNRPPPYFGGFPVIRSPLFNLGRPAIDVKDQGDKYLVEAEVPGVKKENLEVRIGEDGKSLTIEGKLGEATGQPGVETTAEAPPSTETAVAAVDETGNEITSERTFVGKGSFRRTVWLPRPVDSKNVTAILDHGILKLTVKKAEDKGSTMIPIQ
ncbi:putative small heat shock protein (HSP20) family protein [Lyophyllum shimeji]|uniref:Small heat shock protein (HSP20) family protein n=1 Tax=Lyophyllum shimeji TaxID=47721 RepID=A0A9P3PMT5_LYOSH|nr:putative small heat shock protein (HSP20) family protein [Lyophyllum shimeji]